jgi:hypothetical protein
VVAAVFFRRWRRMAIACAAATSCTHLAMHFVVRPLAGSQLVFLVVGEVMATVVEGIVYALVSRPRDLPRAFLASALANSLSFGFGLL